MILETKSLKVISDEEIGLSAKVDMLCPNFLGNNPLRYHTEYDQGCRSVKVSMQIEM